MQIKNGIVSGILRVLGTLKATKIEADSIEGSLTGNASTATYATTAGSAVDQTARNTANAVSGLVGDTSVSNQITTALSTRGVPAPSTSNNGQFLRVVNGVATWSTVPSAEGASF